MKKPYVSPELESVRIRIKDVLTVSEDESGTSGGFINDPDESLLEEDLP